VCVRVVALSVQAVAMDDEQDTWLDSWRAQSVEQLSGRFESLGADDATGWAGSELREDIAQTARYLFLRGVWRRMVEEFDSAVGSHEAERLRAAGGSADDVRRLLRRSFYLLAGNLLYMLDAPDGTTWSTEPIVDVADDDPRWILCEVAPDGEITGRDVVGLHETFSELEPRGDDGQRWI
jgi:hypothetical protein